MRGITGTEFSAGEIFAILNDTAFYFQTYNDTFELKNIPFGIHRSFLLCEKKLV